MPVDPRLASRLRAAAGAGDVVAVRALLAAGAPVDAADARGRTALILAAYRNNVDVAAALVAAGADVNRADDTRQSAYLIATSEVGDDLRLLELTLANGAAVNTKDRFNGTGLIRAAERGNHAICRRLLEAGIERDHVNRFGWVALHEAILLGDGSRRYVRTVRVLVDGGVDVDVPAGRTGERPLRMAQRLGYDEIAAILRSAGARAG